MGENKLNYRTLQVGKIITYKMLLRDQPKNPNKIWRGCISKVYASEYYHDVVGVSVEILEPGFEGENEIVLYCQIETLEEDKTRATRKG